MKASELRVGNWYLSTKFQVPVICEMGDIYEIYMRAEGSTEYNVDETFQPLILTEEWLIKFGFIKDDNGCYWKNDISHYLELLKSGGTWYPVWATLPEFSHEPEQRSTIHYVEYVHQLQNLYFALTSEELAVAKSTPPLKATEEDYLEREN